MDYNSTAFARFTEKQSAIRAEMQAKLAAIERDTLLSQAGKQEKSDAIRRHYENLAQDARAAAQLQAELDVKNTREAIRHQAAKRAEDQRKTLGDGAYSLAILHSLNGLTDPRELLYVHQQAADEFSRKLIETYASYRLPSDSTHLKSILGEDPAKEMREELLPQLEAQEKTIAKMEHEPLLNQPKGFNYQAEF